MDEEGVDSLMDEEDDELVELHLLILNQQMMIVHAICHIAYYLLYQKSRQANLPNEEVRLRRNRVRDDLMKTLCMDQEQCRHLIRMTPDAFIKFCNILKNDGGLLPTQRVSIEEQVAKFLYTLAHDVRQRPMAFFFRRGRSTVSQHFHNVLRAVIELEDKFIKQPTGVEVPQEIRNNKRFYPYFKSKPEAAEWKTKSISKYDELVELFGKDRATGEGAETAKEKKRRWDKIKANSVCSNNMETVDGVDFLASRNEVHLEGFPIDLEDDDVEILHNKQPSQVLQSVSTSSKGKRRKTETMEEVMKISFDKIAVAIERSSESIAKFRPRVISPEEVTEALEEMGVDGQFFDDAYEFLTDHPEKAKKLFGYPKMGRMAYLEKLIYFG